METHKARSRSPRARRQPGAPRRGTVWYLYAISRAEAGTFPVRASGIDGEAAVSAIQCGPYVCWVSRVAPEEFGEGLAQRMENLEWLASVGLRHQQVVAEIAERVTTLPTRFGTVFLSEASLLEHMRERKNALGTAFERVADADEWGIKVFQVARPGKRAEATPASGSEYLKRKAEAGRPNRVANLKDIEPFERRLKNIAIAFHAGGAVSAGQPGLIWHGSFLVKRDQREQLQSVLNQYATKWQGMRRIDCSGPWPAYSFVGDSA